MRKRRVITALGLVALALLGIVALFLVTPTLYAQQYHGYQLSIHLNTGGSGGDWGYSADLGYGQAPLHTIAGGFFFTDNSHRDFSALGVSNNGTTNTTTDDYFFLTAIPKPGETASQIPYKSATELQWFRVDVRTADGVILDGNMWVPTTGTCPADSLCWKARVPTDFTRPQDLTALALDFYETGTEAENHAGGGAGRLSFIGRASVSAGTTTLSCQEGFGDWSGNKIGHVGNYSLPNIQAQVFITENLAPFARYEVQASFQSDFANTDTRPGRTSNAVTYFYTTGVRGGQDGGASGQGGQDGGASGQQSFSNLVARFILPIRDSSTTTSGILLRVRVRATTTNEEVYFRWRRVYPPCYIGGRYPSDMLGGQNIPHTGRLTQITHSADRNTIVLTTDVETPFNARLTKRYSVVPVKRDGERLGKPADLNTGGVEVTADTITVNLQPNTWSAEQLLALDGQAITLVFANEGMARQIERIPGPQPGLTGQLILGLVAGVSAFKVADIGRFITPAREIIALGFICAGMSIIPALNWGGSFWFVGGVAVLALAALAGMLALKSRSG